MEWYKMKCFFLLEFKFPVLFSHFAPSSFAGLDEALNQTGKVDLSFFKPHEQWKLSRPLFYNITSRSVAFKNVDGYYDVILGRLFSVQTPRPPLAQYF